MNDPGPIRRMPWRGTREEEAEVLLNREWLVANGLGGYACGTVSGALTRRYHGLLIAALPGPHGRMMMLSHLWERIRFPDRSVVVLSGEEYAGGPLELQGTRYLTEFRLETGLPVWRYEVNGFVLEKQILMPHRQNTVHVTYRLLSGEGTLRPSVHFRPHHAPVDQSLGRAYRLIAEEDRYELSLDSDLPPLRMRFYGDQWAFTLDRRVRQLFYRFEESRGYESTGEIWSPGYFRVDLTRGSEATLVASAEPWDTIQALSPQRRWRRSTSAAAAPGGGLPRLGQRGLRCRGALRAARMCRPGVERGGAVALLGEDGRPGSS